MPDSCERALASQRFESAMLHPMTDSLPCDALVFAR
jgi:hypothetical protein